MVKRTDDLVRIAAAGGGLVINGNMRRTDELVRIAAAASRHGARLRLKGLTIRPVEELIKIAAAGKGSVIFDL